MYNYRPKKFYESDDFKGAMAFLVLIVGFLGFCYFCAVYFPDCGGDVDPQANCHGTYVHGWNRGRYTSLCMENR